MQEKEQRQEQLVGRAGSPVGALLCYLAPELVVLLLAGWELLLPVLDAGCGLLQRRGQPGVALPQRLQLRLPLLHIGWTEKNQGAIRCLHLIILSVINLYLTADSSTHGACLPMSCFNIRCRYLPLAIACLRRTKATIWPKKGSINSSNWCSRAQVLLSKQAVGSSWQLGSTLFARRGFLHGRHGPCCLQRSCAWLSTRCRAGLGTCCPCSYEATLHICRWYRRDVRGLTLSVFWFFLLTLSFKYKSVT